jgi:hypothetical protein
MAEKEGLKWHEWLTAIGTVIALILGGVTFYYQFLRKTQELRAVVLPVSWDGGSKLTARIAIWNDGTRDEVIEVGELVLSGARFETQRRLFGPEVIKPGEAKAFTANAEFEDLTSFIKGFPVPELMGVTPGKDLRVKLAVVLKTMDRTGGVIVSRAEAGELFMDKERLTGLSWHGRSTRLNLLTGKSLGEVELSPEGVPSRDGVRVPLD